MGVSVVEEGSVTRSAPFGHALVDAAEHDSAIIGLSADLSKYTDMAPFVERFPERFFNVGMAEQNLVCVAAGLARMGLTPVATTYAVFASRRAYDFIAIQCAHARANVKIVAGLPGLTTGYGATHQGIDDLAHMRVMPNLVVIEPCDAVELAQATAAILAYRGPVYMRLLRGEVPVLLDDRSYRFEIGRSRLLREGTDVGIVANGTMVSRALVAAEALAERGVSAAVVNASTLKPFDTGAVLALAQETGALVTAENHSIIGALFSAVAEALATAGRSVPVRPVAIRDKFGECGSLPYLIESNGLGVDHIVIAAEEALTQKRDARGKR
ncbi:MAG: transketolase family protein [Acidimicrobiales bacterium]